MSEGKQDDRDAVCDVQTQHGYRLFLTHRLESHRGAITTKSFLYTAESERVKDEDVWPVTVGVLL